jgi:hypothetical protein
MEEVTDYIYYVKPLRDNTNETIADRLNALGDSAFTTETQKIIVDGKPIYGVYILPHRMLTDLSRSEHYSHLRVYVQEGEGKIRPYFLFKKLTQRLSRTKAVKAVHKTLKTGRV